MTQKHAFITGAAKRVGRELALYLAQHGYDITLHYNDSHEEAQEVRSCIQKLGRFCQLIQANLANSDLCDGLIMRAAQQHMPVTLLVHNASIFEKDTIEDVTVRALRHHMDVNMIAPILLTKDFLKQSDPNVQGQVICMLDGMAGWSISPQFLSYSLSKMALEQFVMLEAVALAPHVRLNAVALGSTLPGHMDKPTTFETIRELTPLKCNSSPEEVCRCVMMLEALPSVTGQVINLSGGLQALKDHVHKQL